MNTTSPNDRIDRVSELRGGSVERERGVRIIIPSPARAHRLKGDTAMTKIF